jgi:ABC-type nickel/cobalt efflux system permease component RcnA
MGDFVIFGMFLASFFLGIKHSLDVDHVAAVSSLLLRSPKITHTIKMAIYWSLGHTITAGILTIILFLMKDVFLTSFLAGFELIIAIMLIAIGIITIILESIKKPKSHSHSHTHHFHFFKKAHHNHPENNHPHNGNRVLRINNNQVAIVLIGVLQGLASNDEMLIILAFTLNLTNLFLVLIGIVLFSLGVTIGMIGWSSLINLPKVKGKQEIIIKWLNISIAILAIVYGTYLLLGGEGINLVGFLG